MTTNTNLSCQSDVEVPCFRCGICCEGPFVSLSLAEARHIADGMGLTWEVWVDRYTEGGWPEAGTLCLRRRDGACVFLERRKNIRVALCSIHAYKPAACRDWTPDLHRRQCQEGLARYWGLAVSLARLIEGPEERLREFQSFCEEALEIAGNGGAANLERRQNIAIGG